MCLMKKRKKMDELKNSYARMDASNTRSRSKSRGKKSSATKFDYKQRQVHKLKNSPQPLVITKNNKEARVVIGSGKKSLYKKGHGASSSGKSSKYDDDEGTTKNHTLATRNDKYRGNNETEKTTPSYNQDAETPRQDNSAQKNTIDLRAKLSQRKAAVAASITTRIIKKN